MKEIMLPNGTTMQFGVSPQGDKMLATVYPAGKRFSWLKVRWLAPALGRPLDLAGDIMRYELGQLDEEQTIVLFQRLVDTGLISVLQGHYGRTAESLYQAGLLSTTLEQHKLVRRLAWEEREAGGYDEHDEYLDRADDDYEDRRDSREIG